MPTAVIDGIGTRYEVTGPGSCLLLFSPGGRVRMAHAITAYATDVRAARQVAGGVPVPPAT
ncbi:hypothetical protein [Streptomyces sp. NBC_00588]|jgi:hypothetical protein|uniref:hypothetical protein n=1 Tax=Streptomyces sp. NBC_00588 TaxID=2975784 RepID=UPI002E820D97|nr:hypothetical protein [Streptomyces sp. NBC_00588]WUB40466.1 hypothetical protein OHN38_38240 [Streptomyces sp. NBC_00588]